MKTKAKTIQYKTYKVATNPFKLLYNLISRFNVVIFITIMAIGLIVSILILANILLKPFSASNSEASSGIITFDQSTIDQLNKLNSSDTNSGYDSLPSGRINPLSE
jgi:hypothetical protein